MQTVYQAYILLPLKWLPADEHLPNLICCQQDNPVHDLLRPIKYEQIKKNQWHVTILSRYFIADRFQKKTQQSKVMQEPMKLESD